MLHIDGEQKSERSWLCLRVYIGHHGQPRGTNCIPIFLQPTHILIAEQFVPGPIYHGLYCFKALSVLRNLSELTENGKSAGLRDALCLCGLCDRQRYT